jgi:hypothetical protein
MYYYEMDPGETGYSVLFAKSGSMNLALMQHTCVATVLISNEHYMIK